MFLNNGLVLAVGIDSVGQVHCHLPLQRLLCASGLVRTKHEIVWTHEAPVQLLLWQHVLFLYVVRVVCLQESDEVVAPRAGTLALLHVLVIVAAPASNDRHVLVGRMRALQDYQAGTAHTAELRVCHQVSLSVVAQLHKIRDVNQTLAVHLKEQVLRLDQRVRFIS